MSCADCTSLYLASASLSPGLRSGWYFLDSLRYALLISSAVADLETPSTSYGSRGMVVAVISGAWNEPEDIVAGGLPPLVLRCGTGRGRFLCRNSALDAR